MMRRAAGSTFCGFFMRLPEPFSSPAPRFDGQRWLSGGTFHWAAAASGRQSNAAASAVRFMVIPLLESFVEALVVQSAGHLRQLVAEFALVRRHAVGVERLARAPGLDHREMVGAVGLLHDLVAHVALGGAARPAPGL